MKCIRNLSTDPHFNLALDEYILKIFDPSEDYIMLWQNEPSIIIGHNQNTHEEINAKYVKENNIHVVRRMSGGGAVYHDLGNLNFSFFVNNDKDVVSNFKKFTEPIIKALQKLGVPCEFSGRNDITIDGKKFSGNAQYYFGNRLLHHGTILFNSDLSIVQEALNVKLEKIESKGIKSVRSRVTNIYPYLNREMTALEFKDILLKYLLGDDNYAQNEYILTDNDISGVRELMDKKYSTWEWNYGESPEFDIEKGKRIEGVGKIEIKTNVKAGIIEKIKIYGDFFGKKDISEIENMIIGKLYKEESIYKVIDVLDISEYFAGLAKEDFIDIMFY